MGSIITASDYSSTLPAERPATMPSPVHIERYNWGYWMERRELVLELNSDLPHYLVLPEIHQVLDALLDYEMHFLVSTLWHTGARISEALALTRENFRFDSEWNAGVIIPNAKVRRGRPKKTKKKKSDKRFVPILNQPYMEAAKRYLATQKPNKGEPIFTLSRFQVNRRLTPLVEQLQLPIETLSPHTFRHSFAINLLLHNRPLKFIQELLGHTDSASTEIYTAVLAGETYHLMHGVEF